MHSYKISYLLDGCGHYTTNLKYQIYLINGFRKLPSIDFSIEPAILKLPFSMAINGFRRTGLNWLSKARKFYNRYDCVSDVGRYLIWDRETGKIWKIAVDGSDGWQVRDEVALEWTDIYFKNNYWPSKLYPHQKVRPLMNGDGLLSPRIYDLLVRGRASKKTYDLIYWTKIWMPKGNSFFTLERCENIVEHQLRLYESLSKIRCKKILGVELSNVEFDGAKTERVVKRLNSAGVFCQRHRLTQKEFWERHLASKIVFARPGDHLCISFRISAFLMAGACIVYDAEPFVQWHEPLVPGAHYMHGNSGLGVDYSLPDKTSYCGIIDCIENLLANKERMESLKSNAARYFDIHSSPEALARYVLSCCSET